MKKSTLNRSLFVMVATAMLSAVSLVLMLIEFPLLPGAAYLKMDFSDIPALLGAILFGPLCGVLIELIKNILEMLIKGLGTQLGFGNLMNFIIGCAYLLPFSIFYHSLEKKAKPVGIRIFVAAAAGMIVMVVLGFFANMIVAPLFFRYFLQTPLGSNEVLAYAWISVPFNLLKGVVITVVMIPLLTIVLKPVRRMVDKVC